jgi:type II secretory pathway pseudopilin PulG
MTLIELLVSMGLLSIVSGLVVSMMVTSINANADSERLVSSTQFGQSAADSVGRSLRAAVNPLTSAAANTYTQGFLLTAAFEAKYYANVKNLASAVPSTAPSLTGPALVDDKVVVNPANAADWQLVETTTPASGSSAPYTWPASGTRTRVLAHGLADPTLGSTPALFTYYRPTYYTSGTASDIAIGQAACAASSAAVPALASTAGGVAWVGAQSNLAVSGTVAGVAVALTLSNNGTGGPAYSRTSKTVSVNARVTIDAANTSASRGGTCL